MTNEQQFEEDLLNIIKYSTELLQDLKNIKKKMKL